MSRQPYYQTVKWLPEYKEFLKKLWDDKTLSCNKIKDAMNAHFGIELTKYAIIGAAHRMVLEKRQSPIKKNPYFDLAKFIQMYNDHMVPLCDIIKEFSLHNSYQVHYRADKYGLKKRQKNRSRPERTDNRKSEYVHAMLDPDTPGIPIQTYERVNMGSRKWFSHNAKCGAVPCEYLAVPTGRLCYSHSGVNYA